MSRNLAREASGDQGPPVTGRQPTPTAGNAGPGLTDADWSEREAPRQSLRVRLPDGARWRREETAGTWTRFLHEPTQTRLLMRHQSAHRNISAQTCEKEARYSQPALVAPSDVLVERRSALPGNYHGYVRVSLLATGETMVSGFFAGIGRCLIVVWLPGPGSRDPGSLRLASDVVVPSVRVLGVTDRASRPPL